MFQVWIGNLGKYNEGELVGEWFTPPVYYEDLQERIGLNEQYEEYQLHDWEDCPVELDRYTSLDYINNIAEWLEVLENEPFFPVIDEIMGHWFSDLEELAEHKDDIIYYYDCDTMEDVAYYMIDEYYSDIPEFFKRYFSYESYSRDLEIEGNFLETKIGVIEYLQ